MARVLSDEFKKEMGEAWPITSELGHIALAELYRLRRTNVREPDTEMALGIGILVGEGRARGLKVLLDSITDLVGFDPSKWTIMTKSECTTLSCPEHGKFTWDGHIEPVACPFCQPGVPPEEYIHYDPPSV